jgi:hypothetical protein
LGPRMRCRQIRLLGGEEMGDRARTSLIVAWIAATIIVASLPALCSQLSPMQLVPLLDLSPYELHSEPVAGGVPMHEENGQYGWGNQTPTRPVTWVSSPNREESTEVQAPPNKTMPSTSIPTDSVQLKLNRGGTNTGTEPATRALQELAMVRRSGGGCTIIATALTVPGIAVKEFAYPEGQAALPHFSATVGKRLDWLVEIRIENHMSGTEWVSFSVSIDFGPGFEVDMESAPSVTFPETPGGSGQNALEVTQGSKPGEPTHVHWKWQHQGKHGSKFSCGSEAHMVLKVTATSLSTSSLPAVFCDGIAFSFSPEGKPASVRLDPIYVRMDEDHATVLLGPPEVHWYVLGPGTFAALAAEVSVSGTQPLYINFSGFDDLVPTTGAPSVIRVWYSFSADLPEPESPLWVPAEGLANLGDGRVPRSLDPAVPMRMWIKIHISESTLSADYENRGVITFTASNL